VPNVAAGPARVELEETFGRGVISHKLHRYTRTFTIFADDVAAVNSCHVQ
jgi:hypothetical protein